MRLGEGILEILHDGVSIHAPREGCDRKECSASRLQSRFNSRTPGGVRLIVSRKSKDGKVFQFTHPGRGATVHSPCMLYHSCSFNSRTPGGVRRLRISFKRGNGSFNSRTPGGVRRCRNVSSSVRAEFQFTHPGRGATSSRSWRELSTSCFNSRTPGGVRHMQNQLISSQVQFQFTHPGRGATREHTTPGAREPVSIHAPREGCDFVVSKGGNPKTSFNSRTPGGVRLSALCLRVPWCQVSIHAPREGCDCYDKDCRLPTLEVSIHAPREGCDPIVMR